MEVVVAVAEGADSWCLRTADAIFRAYDMKPEIDAGFYRPSTSCPRTADTSSLL
jgi:hypothetical protein